MTLRIAKVEENHRSGQMPVETPVVVVMEAPEAEVVGIPGLVREMIGRFSCHG